MRTLGKAAVLVCTVSLLLAVPEREAQAQDMSFLADPLLVMVACMAVAGGIFTVVVDVANLHSIVRHERARTAWIVLGLLLGGIESSLGASFASDEPEAGFALLSVGALTVGLAFGSLAMPSFRGSFGPAREPQHDPIPVPSFGLD